MDAFLNPFSQYITQTAWLLNINPAASAVLIFLSVVLFTVSFLISGAEVAFFSLTYKDINMLKTKQQPSFKRIISLLEQPETLLASMKIVNSIVNITIILMMNTLLDEWLRPLQLAGFGLLAAKGGVIILLLVLFGELIPKIWATHHKVWFASTASLVVEICNSLSYRFSQRMVNLGRRVEKQSAGANQQAMDDREFDYAIDLLPDHEASQDEKKILKGIRKFADTTVKQIMRTRLDVSGIAHDVDFDTVIRMIEELHYSRLPVYKQNLDEIAGMLHTKDLIGYVGQTPEGFDWHTLIRPAYFVHEQKGIEDLLQEFRNRRIHFAVVVDEFGGTSGIVTLEDIMEEVIGDIKDEFDEEEASFRKIDDHTYVFEGKTMINDVCKLLQLPVEQFDELRGNSDSLAGLVLEIAGEFPQVNSEIEVPGFIFIPLEINKNRIDQVKIILKTDAVEPE